jgi:hypothetical protein
MNAIFAAVIAVHGLPGLAGACEPADLVRQPQAAGR